MSFLTPAQAIARQEGFYQPDSRAARNNNPGNINFEQWLADEYGAILETPIGNEQARFCHFPSLPNGWAALDSVLLKYYVGLPIHDVLNKWAPPSDGNDTSAYENDFCLWTGLESTDILTFEDIS